MPVLYSTAIVHPFHVALRLNFDWCFFFFFSWSGTSQERRTFWCSDRDRLSLWQPRQLALIISANGKMRKRFFASPTSNSSSLWQLRRHCAAGRMFTQTDYGNARCREWRRLTPNSCLINHWIPAAAPLWTDRNCLSSACDNVLLWNFLLILQTCTDTPAGLPCGKHLGSWDNPPLLAHNSKLVELSWILKNSISPHHRCYYPPFNNSARDCWWGKTFGHFEVKCRETHFSCTVKCADWGFGWQMENLAVCLRLDCQHPCCYAIRSQSLILSELQQHCRDDALCLGFTNIFHSWAYEKILSRESFTFGRLGNRLPHVQFEYSLENMDYYMESLGPPFFGVCHCWDYSLK